MRGGRRQIELLQVGRPHSGRAAAIVVAEVKRTIQVGGLNWVQVIDVVLAGITPRAHASVAADGRLLVRLVPPLLLPRLLLLLPLLLLLQLLLLLWCTLADKVSIRESGCGGIQEPLCVMEGRR